MNKPEILYHGSPNKNIDEFEPRLSSGSGEGNGLMVYATDDLVAASIFLADVRGHAWSVGRFGEYGMCLSLNRVRISFPRDVGGCIYELPSTSFQTGTVGGFGEQEYASPIPIRPVGKRLYASSLQAMLQNGVQVYFIGEKTLADIKASSDHGYAILHSLQSENQRLEVSTRLF